jgi:hypothetical protein
VEKAATTKNKKMEAAGDAIPSSKKKAKFTDHECCEVCKSSFPKEGSPEACAMKHLLASVQEAVPRFVATGTQTNVLKQAKITFFQSICHTHLAQKCYPCNSGLLKTSAVMLNVSNHVMTSGSSHKGNQSNEQMNARLISGEDVVRAARCDKYPQEDIYEYFHGDVEGKHLLPDYSSKVELDKSKKTQWQARRWKPSWSAREIYLTCSPRLRRGTKAMCVLEYFGSETHAK